MPSSSFHSDWIRPHWPAPAHIHALCTSRAGGVSVAPYDSLNLGDHVGDVPQAVQTNRQRLQAALQANTPQVQTQAVFLRQVHGVQTIYLTAGLPDGYCADACTTTAVGPVCTIMVADCLPVLLCDASGQWVAAAHAGWRGLAGANGRGVLESLLSELPLVGSDASEVLAWLGPCIGPQAFEVGQEVRAAFVEALPSAQAWFEPLPNGQFLADLAGLARQRLQALGVRHIYGNNSQAPWCTFTQSGLYFSHRRDARLLGQSGRMAACIWRDD